MFKKFNLGLSPEKFEKFLIKEINKRNFDVVISFTNAITSYFASQVGKQLGTDRLITMSIVCLMNSDKGLVKERSLYDEIFKNVQSDFIECLLA